MIKVTPASAEIGDWDWTDEHVIRFPGGIPAGFADQVAASGGEVVRELPQIRVVITKGLTDAAAAQISGAAIFSRDVEMQQVPSPDEIQSSPEALPDGVVQGHDPTQAFFFKHQWDMRIIKADAAWNAGFEGNPGVRVAVLDTGIDPLHIDLAGLVDLGASATFVGPSAVGPPHWNDDHFHGTHVAGTIVTNGIGTSGVAPHTTLIAVKVLNRSGFGSFAGIISGIVHAADQGADVINMSLGALFPKNVPDGGALVAALNGAVNYANSKGVLVVSSAGNRNADLQHSKNLISTPCENGAGVCVSSTGPTDLRAFYSNYGVSTITVSAPGGDSRITNDPFTSRVLAPCASAVCGGPNFYVLAQGTSMAAPHVSGADALLDAQHGGALKAGQLKTRLQQTADDLGKKGIDADHGKGRINVCRLVDC